MLTYLRIFPTSQQNISKCLGSLVVSGSVLNISDCFLPHIECFHSTEYFIFYVNLEDEKCFKYYNPPCILIIIVNPSPGRQGNDIGDVKFNSDGDGLGRYSVYQYQHTVAGGWEYNWIGEFGEKDNFRWDKVNKTGEVQI